MGVGQQPFIGAEALTSGDLTRYELRRYYRAIMPNVYLDKRIELSLQQRTVGACLWSGRDAVVAGLAASALHGAKWIDDDTPVELVWRNARSPHGVVTRDQLLLENEIQRLDGLAVTSPERTAFDIGRRGRLDDAVARLDALAQATDFKVSAVEELVSRHRHTRGLRQLEAVLDLVDAGAESPKENVVAALGNSRWLPATADANPGAEPRRPPMVLPRHGVGGSIAGPGIRRRSPSDQPRAIRIRNRTRGGPPSVGLDRRQSGCAASDRNRLAALPACLGCVHSLTLR
jgi:hypothetical protein